MTVMTQPLPRFALRRHHPATTAALVVAFWVAAAALVAAAHKTSASAVAPVVALFATSFAYNRLVAREAGAMHALGVGIVWLTLSIVVEMAVTVHMGHGWFTLLGAPSKPLLRQLLLFAWVFSPLLSSRRRSD